MCIFIDYVNIRIYLFNILLTNNNKAIFKYKILCVYTDTNFKSH